MAVLPGDADGFPYPNPTQIDPYVPPNTGNTSVRALQTQLNSLGANLVVDGINGPLTQAAQRKFLGGGSTPGTTSSSSSSSSSVAGPSSSLKALQEQKLAQAIAAIQGQYKYKISEAQGRFDQLGPLLSRSLVDLNDQQVSERGQLEAGFVNRGLVRSGLFSTDMARHLRQFTDEKTRLTGKLSSTAGSLGTDALAIRSEQEAFEQAQAAAIADAKIQKEIEELEIEEALARIRAGV